MKLKILKALLVCKKPSPNKATSLAEDYRLLVHYNENYNFYLHFDFLIGYSPKKESIDTLVDIVREYAKRI